MSKASSLFFKNSTSLFTKDMDKRFYFSMLVALLGLVIFFVSIMTLDRGPTLYYFLGMFSGISSIGLIVMLLFSWERSNHDFNEPRMNDAAREKLFAFFKALASDQEAIDEELTFLASACRDTFRAKGRYSHSLSDDQDSWTKQEQRDYAVLVDECDVAKLAFRFLRDGLREVYAGCPYKILDNIGDYPDIVDYDCSDTDSK